MFKVPLDTVKVPLLVNVRLQKLLSVTPMLIVPPPTVKVALKLLVTPVVDVAVTDVVPPLIFTVPELVMVEPTAKVLPLTVNTPVLFTVILPTDAAVALTVTVCPAAITTSLEAFGTAPD